MEGTTIISNPSTSISVRILGVVLFISIAQAQPSMIGGQRQVNMEPPPSLYPRMHETSVAMSPFDPQITVAAWNYVRAIGAGTDNANGFAASTDGGSSMTILHSPGCPVPPSMGRNACGVSFNLSCRKSNTFSAPNTAQPDNKPASAMARRNMEARDYQKRSARQEEK